MTINLKNFLKDKAKFSKKGECQELQEIDGMEISAISADLYGDGRDDLALFYFTKGANYASLTTSRVTFGYTSSSSLSFTKQIISASFGCTCLRKAILPINSLMLIGLLYQNIGFF